MQLLTDAISPDTLLNALFSNILNWFFPVMCVTKKGPYTAWKILSLPAIINPPRLWVLGWVGHVRMMTELTGCGNQQLPDKMMTLYNIKLWLNDWIYKTTVTSVRLGREFWYLIQENKIKNISSKWNMIQDTANRYSVNIYSRLDTTSFSRK